MVIERVFIDTKSRTELRCWLTEKDELYIELTDVMDPYEFQYVVLPVDEARVLVEHIMDEINKAK
jgi:hypothetical protein